MNQTPRQRAAEKRQLLCSWLGIFGHSTEAVLMTMLGVRARGICAKLGKEGLLLPVPVPLSNVRVWALTNAGLRVAELALQRRVRYVSHPERLTLSRLAHDLSVQREAIARLPTDLIGLRRLRADRELRDLDAAVRPDVMVNHFSPAGVETCACLEVEVSSKGREELSAKMRAILGVLRPRMLWLWCITEGEAARDRYARTWADVVAREGAGYGLTRAQLLSACHFELVKGES